MSVPITNPATTTTSGVSQSWSSVGISVSESVVTGSASGTGGWSLPRSSVRSISGSSRSRSGSASDDDLDNSNENDESESVDGEEFGFGRRYGRGRVPGYGYAGYSHHRTQQKAWKKEDDDMVGTGWSLREEDEYEKAERKVGVKGEKEEWDGMEMEMDMD